MKKQFTKYLKKYIVCCNLIQFCLTVFVDELRTLAFMIIDNIIGTDHLTEKEQLSNTDSIDYVHAFAHRIKHQRIVRHVHAFIPSEKNPNM